MSYQTLFLQQSYRDCTKQYEEILHNPNLPLWDYVVLTASNEAQAQAYRAQISYRLKHQMLPEKTHYAVLPDPDGKRVGSGGATLNVLRYIREHAAGKPALLTIAAAVMTLFSMLCRIAQCRVTAQQRAGSSCLRSPAKQLATPLTASVFWSSIPAGTVSACPSIPPAASSFPPCRGFFQTVVDRRCSTNL